MNQLAQAKSPYLKSAAEQPVRWLEWNEEAFQEARKQDKPILLDIGAVWCHWCHVIDRESYENEEIANLINKYFIAIKVDRDERPDIDSRYQQAVGALTGSGGWPLTAFLTPNGDVFYGGTYFPPKDAHGRPGFPNVLERIAQVYRERKDEVIEDAQKLKETLRDFHGFKPSEVNSDIINSMVESAKASFDPDHGGFGTAPKFPHPTTLDFLIHEWFRNRSDEIKSMVEKTLAAMGEGGVYDHIGGGFHRYSTDERWIVPHFEKMIYDNSELLKTYVHAYQAFDNPYFKEKALDLIRWVNEVLSDQTNGGFYASQDADINLDDDGNYFTWTKKEAEAILSKEEAEAVLPYYGIEEHGEMHHEPDRNVLYVALELESIAKKLNISKTEVEQRLESGKAKMLEARKKRPTPFVDRSLYTNWNAMMIVAYLDAYEGLELEHVKTSALKTLDRFIHESQNGEGGVTHSLGGASPLKHFLDDQAQMMLAFLRAYEITADLRYLDFAKQLGNYIVEHFTDQEGGFFDLEESKQGSGYLSIKQKSIQDSPTPNANASATLGLLKLHTITHEAKYREEAEKALRFFAAPARGFGHFASQYGLALDFYLTPVTKVVVTGTKSNAEFSILHETALRTFRPNKVVQALDVSELDAFKKTVIASDSEAPPKADAPLAQKQSQNSWIASIATLSRNDKPLAYVCVGNTCQFPTSDPEKLKELIRKTK